MWLKKILSDKKILTLGVIILVFAFIYSYLGWPENKAFDLQPRFDWPDETANYFWIGHFAQTGELSIPEPLNTVAKNQIHPRSFNVNGNGDLLPGSFLGLIIFYAFFVKIFGPNVVFVLGCILAALSALPFYFIVKKFFDDKIAYISSVLMLFFPAWWYYASSPLLPNTLFIFFFLVSLAILLEIKNSGFIKFFISGLFFGLALVVRPSEFIWTFFLVFFALVLPWKNFRWKNLIVFILPTIIIFLPIFYFQSHLYGSIVGTGYDQLQNQGDSRFIILLKSLILPFGFNPIVLLKNIWHHYLLRFWFFNLLAFLGFILYTFKFLRSSNFYKNYLIFSSFLYAWLLMFYGNWQFEDQMTVNLNTLAISYVRYWLILYLLPLPFIAFLILNLSHKFGKIKNLILPLILFALFLYSGNLTLLAKNDGLLRVKSRVFSYYQSAQKINELTEPDSVIIVNRKDKVIFPERKVIHTFSNLSDDDLVLSFLPDLSEKAPIYYLALTPIENKLFVDGKYFDLVQKINQEYLYKLK